MAINYKFGYWDHKRDWTWIIRDNLHPNACMNPSWSESSITMTLTIFPNLSETLTMTSSRTTSTWVHKLLLGQYSIQQRLQFQIDHVHEPTNGDEYHLNSNIIIDYICTLSKKKIEHICKHPITSSCRRSINSTTIKCQNNPW